MSSRLFIPVFLIFVFIFYGATPFDARAEIIQVSKLKEEKKDFSMKRDIFSPIKLPEERIGSTPVENLIPEKPPEIEEKKEEEPKREEPQVRYNILFEGYLIRKDRSHALLKVNGEEFIAGEQEIIKDMIKIVKVDKKELTVEIEANIIKIQLTGDDQENVQTNEERL